MTAAVSPTINIGPATATPEFIGDLHMKAGQVDALELNNALPPSVYVNGFEGPFKVSFLPAEKPRHNYGLLAKASSKLQKPQKTASTGKVIKISAVTKIDHAGPG